MQTSNRRLESCRASPMSKQLWGQSQHNNTGSWLSSWTRVEAESPWPTQTGDGRTQEAERCRQQNLSFLWSMSVTTSQGTHIGKCDMEAIYWLCFCCLWSVWLTDLEKHFKAGGILVHFVLLQQNTLWEVLHKEKRFNSILEPQCPNRTIMFLGRDPVPQLCHTEKRKQNVSVHIRDQVHGAVSSATYSQENCLNPFTRHCS